MRKKLFYLLTFLLATAIGFDVGWANTTDTLNYSLIGVSGTSYSSWSGKTSNSDAVYAGNSAGDNNAIQLRTNNSNSGIVTTTSGGKVRKITITYNTNTRSGRTLNIYGSNTAYTAASQLYNSTERGTDIGANDLTPYDGTSSTKTQTVTVSGDYTYVGIKSSSGALYLDEIQIEWEDETVVDPPAAPSTVAFSPVSGSEVTIGSTVTLSMSSGTSTGIKYTTDGTTPSASNGTEGTSVTLTGTAGSTVTVTAVAYNTNSAGTTYGDTTQAIYTLKAAPSYLFYESFDTNDGTGGNDGNWSGNIATNNFQSDNDDWVVSNASGANQCARFGTGTQQGSATTPSITVTSGETYKLTFKAAAWNGNSEATNLPISASGANIYSDEDCTTSISSVTMTKGAWTTYTVYLSATSSSLTFTWQGNSTNNSRFFLDEITLEHVASTPKYTVTATASPAGAGTFTYDPAAAATTGVVENTSVGVTATAASGYQFSGWSVTAPSGWVADQDYLADGNEITFDMPAQNVTLTATFAEIPTYAVTIDSNITGGSVSVSPTGNQAAGTTMTITATPSTGYQLDAISVYETGQASNTVTVDNNNQFTMPAYGVTVTATFSKINYTLTRNSSNLQHGDVKITDASGAELATQPTTAQIDDVIYFKPTTVWGYQVGTITVTNTTANTTITPDENNGVYSFTMPAGNVTINVTFVEYISDLYIMGLANDNTWAYNVGVPMTKPADSSGSYTARVYFSNAATGTFSFSEELGENNNWPADSKRYNPASNNYDLEANNWTAAISNSNNSDNALLVPAGIYDISVNYAKTQVTLTPVTPTAVLDPATGAEVATGVTVSFTSNLDSLLQAINDQISVTTTYVIDSEAAQTGSTATLSTNGTHTVAFTAAYNNITATATGSYTVATPVTPIALFHETFGDNSGSARNWDNTYSEKSGVAAVYSGITGYTVTEAKQSKNNQGYVASCLINTTSGSTGNTASIIMGPLSVADYESLKLYYQWKPTSKSATYWTKAYFATSSSGEYTELTTSSTGDPAAGSFNEMVYSLPSSAEVSTLYLKIEWLTSNTNGAIDEVELQGVLKQVEPKDYRITYATSDNGTLSGPGTADAGDSITVTATGSTVDGTTYGCNGISVTGVNAEDITDNGDGTYSFVMPAQDVTVTGSWLPVYSITGVSNPAGKATVTPSANSAIYGTTISVTVTDIDSDYQLSKVTYTYNGATYDCAGSGPYTFGMPGYDVTVTAVLAKVPHTITVVNNNSLGTVSNVPATATSGTTVTFSVAPSSSNYTVNLPVVTFQYGDESTGTASVTDNGDGTYTFTMPPYDVTISVTYTIPFASSEYKLITKTSDLEAGVDYLITKNVTTDSETGAKSTTIMGKMASGYAGTVTDVTVSADNVITSTQEMAIITLGGETGAWTLRSTQGYLHNDNNTKNNLSVSDNATGYATIELNSSSNGAATVTFTTPSTYNQLQYNSESPRFAAYNGGQSKVYFWKEYNSNKVKTPAITDKGIFIGKDTVTLTTKTAEASIYYTLDGTEPSASNGTLYSGPFEITAAAYGDQVTVKAIAIKSEMDDSDVATSTFTCGKPTAPTFGVNWNGKDTTYYNPMFIYPKSALAERRAYGVENVKFYYVTDSSTPSTSGTEVTLSNSTGKYIYLDDDALLGVITVINGIPSDAVEGVIEFKVAQPVFKFRDGTFAPTGTYDGDQEIGMSTATKTSQNNVSWTTEIWYTTGNTAFTFNSTTGEVTSEGWSKYTTGSYVTIPAGATTELRAYTLTNYFAGKSEWRASAVTDSIYEVTAAALKLIATPAAGSYLNTQNVTLTTRNAIGNVTITYTIEWANGDPDTYGTYDGTPITIDKDATLYAVAIDSREGDVATTPDKTAEILAEYKIGTQAPTYSPYPGNYYSIDEMTVEMFSVTPNAKIYYTMTDDGTTPDDPTSASTFYDESNPPVITAGKTYNFKAIAYVGAKASGIAPATYTISTADSNIATIDSMNHMSTGSTGTLSNPVQVIYNSKWRNIDNTPEFVYVRDNSGYGLIYFGALSDDSSKQGYYQNHQGHIFEMGDWIAGDQITSKVAVWSDGFHNEFGSSSRDVSNWPSERIGNTPIMPETTTNAEINAGWLGDETFSGSNYADYMAEDNLWGHYVHMRKNTINVTSTGTGGGNGKHAGFITDESGVELYYYDVFYNFSGYNNSKDYNKKYFDSIQAKGATVDIYAIVGFYGPNAKKSSANYSPIEIFPIDFKMIYKPMIVGVDSTSTYHEAKTVTLTCESDGAQIWYKTSQMEGFELYTGPFTVDQSTTIETYSTLPVPEYNDEMESVVNSMELQFGTVEQPEISPESSVNAVGDPAITVTITCPTDGATIWYTTDNSDPKTSETRQQYSGSLSIDETTTVRAIAEADDFYSVEAEQKTYTFVKSNGIEYTLVTSDDDLDEYSVYVIVNKENAMAMQRTQKDNNRDAAGVMFKPNTNDSIVYGNDDLAIFTLAKTGSNWYLHTSNGSNNASTGFLYGALSGTTNQLKTDTSDDPATSTHASDIELSIDVTVDNIAHISNIYNGENTRYLRFNKTYNLFNTYSSEVSGQAVYLYKAAAMPLATIEKIGVPGNQYTIADELVGVKAVGNILWAKDQGNVSIAKTEIADGQIDYMNMHLFNDSREWDQSNWVAIKFTNDDAVNSAAAGEGYFIKPATLAGTYIDDENYTIELPNRYTTLETNGQASYTNNVYGPANFNSENFSITKNGKSYYFLNPKIQEVATITWAVWKDGMFVIPTAGSGPNGTNNQEDLDGAFSPDWSFQQDLTEQLNRSDSPSVYEFKAVIRKKTSGGDTPARRRVAADDNTGKPGQTASDDYVVAPLDLTVSSGIVTGIDDINGTVEGKEVKAVRVYNVAGVEMRELQPGVNIVVTEYNDGTTTTRKVMK